MKSRNSLRETLGYYYPKTLYTYKLRLLPIKNNLQIDSKP